jgi:hypothetical protein
MTTMDIIIALTIHLIVPLSGLLYFLKLRKQMHRDNIENAPTRDLFLVFCTYGGLLLVALTALFWKWSGLASLGTFYLILAAPIIMGVIAYRNRSKVEISKYHLIVFRAGLLYFLFAPLTFGLLFAFADNS